MDTDNKLTWGKTKEIEENWPFLKRLLQYPPRTPQLDGQELELDCADRNEVQDECGSQALSANTDIRSQAEVDDEEVQHITREPTYLEENAEIHVTSDGADIRESVHEISEDGVHTPTVTGEDELASCGSEIDLSTQITELENLNSSQVGQLNVYRARMAQLQDQLQVSKSGRIGKHTVAEVNTSRIKPVISPMSFSVKKAGTDAIEIASRWRRDEELAKLHTAPLQTADADEHTEKTRLLDEEMRKWAITSINLTNELSTTKQKLFQIRLRRHMRAKEARVAAGLDMVENEDVHLFEYHSQEDSSEDIDKELEENTRESNEIELPTPGEYGLRSNVNPTPDESDSTDVDLAFSNQTPMLSPTDITPWSADDKDRLIVLTVTDTAVADSGCRDEEDKGQNVVTNESRFTESRAMSDATEILTELLLDFNDATEIAPQQSPSSELNVTRVKEVNHCTDGNASKIEIVEDVINISVDLSNQSDSELDENIECNKPDISGLSKPNVFTCPVKTLNDKTLASDTATLTGVDDGSLQADGEFDDVTAETYYHSYSHKATLHQMCPRCSLTSKRPCAHIVYEKSTQEVVEDCFDEKEKFVQELTNDLNEQLNSMMVYNGLLISINSHTVDSESVTGLPVFQSEHDLARNTCSMKEAKDFESEMKLHKLNDRVTIHLEEYENANKDEIDALGLEQVSTGRVLKELADLSSLNIDSRIAKGREEVQVLESGNKESLLQTEENNSIVNPDEKEAVESSHICRSNTNITHSNVAAEQFEIDKLQNTPNSISDSIDQGPQEPLKAVDSNASVLSNDSENLEYISAEEDIEEDCAINDEKSQVIIDREESQQTQLKLGKTMLKQIENQSSDSLTNLKSKVHELEEELAQIHHYLDERDQKYQVSSTSQMCRRSTPTLLQSVFASEPPSQHFNSGVDITASIPQPSYKQPSSALRPQRAAPSTVLQPHSATPSTVLQHQSTTPSTVLHPQSATTYPFLQLQGSTTYPVLQLQSAPSSPVLQSGYTLSYNTLHPATIPHFDVNIIGQLTTDSILIGWEVPYDGAIKSFRIYIDQEPKLSIHSGSRSSAVIHQVNLSVFFAINVHAIGLHGLCIAIGSTDYAPYPVKRNNL